MNKIKNCYRDVIDELVLTSDTNGGMASINIEVVKNDATEIVTKAKCATLDKENWAIQELFTGDTAVIKIIVCSKHKTKLLAMVYATAMITVPANVDSETITVEMDYDTATITMQKK